MRLTLSQWFGALAAVALVAEAAAPATGKDRLRQLVRLPALELRLGIPVFHSQGFSLFRERHDALVEIEEVRKALLNNSSDAPRHYRIGILLRKAGETAQAERALNKAVELYRQQGADTSDNGELMAGFGEALAATGRTEEAERLLRQAAKVAPRQWRCHAALGRFLVQQAWASVQPGDQNATGARGGGVSGGLLDLLRAPLPPAQVEKTQKRVKESLECLDRAIELAPEEAEAYTDRATCKVTRGIVETAVRLASGEVIDPAKTVAAMFPAAPLEDLRQAARLSPNDYHLLAAASLYEFSAAAVEQGASPFSLDAPDLSWLPEKTRQTLRLAIDRFADLGQGNEPRAAAGALEMQGFLQGLVMQDGRGAEPTLRRAVSLDPGREQAWELLVGLQVKSKRYEELAELCEARLRVADSPRNRVFLAKAYEKLRQTDRAFEEAEAAQRRFPEDFTVTLTLAAALMKLNSDSVSLIRVAQLVSRAEQLMGRSPTTEQLRNLLLVRGFCYGLVGQVDQARANFKKLLEFDKENEEAQEALRALETQ